MAPRRNPVRHFPQGVTLVATLRPRDMALTLAGKHTDPARWESDRRALREKVKEAAAAQKKLQKERERAERKGASSGSSGRSGADRDAARDAAGGVQGAAGAQGAMGVGVVLRPGVVVDPEEAEEVVDDDSLVMLARGVAYAGCGQVEPLVKRLYQQVELGGRAHGEMLLKQLKLMCHTGERAWVGGREMRMQVRRGREGGLG